MQICQSIVVCLVDENRVDVGNIQAAFNDCGRHQDVGFLLDEIEHGFFQLVLVHLTMSHGDAGLQHHRLNLPCHFLDVVNSVVDEIDLSVAIELAQDGLADKLGIETGDAGFNRQPIGRGRLQVADVTNAQERQV